MAQVPESHRDLLNAEFATLATLGPDGRPQLSEVWFVAEGDQVSVSLNTGRQKTKNLLARPACCLFILDLTNPGRYLEIRGDALVSDDENFATVEKVTAKYGANVREFDGPDDRRVVVTITPSKINAVNISS